MKSLITEAWQVLRANLFTYLLVIISMLFFYHISCKFSWIVSLAMGEVVVLSDVSLAVLTWRMMVRRGR
ncbi:hypothetical protein FD733_02260 [Pantoea sp. Eser]|nr:hypothetical protein [Pantoea sp. Eser]